MMLDNSGRDAKTASPTILVIDDDPIALEELGEILELAELRSVSAGNTEEALMLLNARPDIGIVVTDVHIREDDGQMKNGIEFVAEAQRRFSERDMRFIVISGDAGAASASVNTGVTDFLTKPMIAEELLAAIKEAADAKVLKASETDPNAFLVRMFNKKVESLQRAQASLADNENAMAKARDETRRLRETDPESGLINGVQLAREIDALESKKGALITFELGGLANIRDGSDHAVAVALILDYAERLRDMAGPDDLVARIGRQEIALYLADGDDREELAAIAHRARQRISRSRVAEDLNVLVTPTAGIAMRDARGQDGDALMAESAFALRHALADRPGATSFYEVGTRSNSDRNQALAVKLRKGIEKRHVRPWFQPQIDLKTGEIVGWEALARWRDPEDGMRSPAEFLPLAKEVGLMRDLDLAIQIQALTAMRELERFGLAGHRMSINVTSDELKDASFLDCLKIELERVGFGFDRVAIEILESTMLDDPEAEPIKTGIERLSALGASIELDDFGTGHAGLSSLRDLPVNRVKIDRSFVDGIDKKPELQTFSRALIGLAKALGVEVLAEGVERQEELDWLRKEGCDVVQGYFTGRPMPLDDIAAWAETRLAS